MESIDTVIIGAGVVGLALARSLSPSRSVVVLEQEAHTGAHLSSRNSEVIHAGLYYPPDSLKARLCLAGNEALYQYCDMTGVPYRRCSKLVVAQAGQELQLQQLQSNAESAGAKGLRRLSRAQWQQQEPWLKASEVLLSTRSGIIDSHAFLYHLQQDAEKNGAVIALRHRVEQLECEDHRYTLVIMDSDNQPLILRCRQLIIAAGLYGVSLLEQAEGFPGQHIPELRQARGNYFSLTGKSPTQRLIYPMPESHGLGIHLTVDLAGQARFGPDVEWIEPTLPPDYRVNGARKPDFLNAIRQYWPGVDATRLQPSYAGVRPKLYRDGLPVKDFLIQGEDTHGLAGMINLLGIESPGLTAALAIAEDLQARLD